MFLSVFAGLSFTSNESANAASYPTTHPNTYKNTGKGATDIVGVARTQLGYQENGVGTKYGYWYIPSFVNQPWCAMFISWCANQAKIPTTQIPRFASCTLGMQWFQSQKRWYNSKYFGGKYTPKKGDIVFYCDAGVQSYSSHVGIVLGVNGNYLHVIEGNSTNASVCEFTNNSSRTLTSSYVIGYGHPKYSTSTKNEPKTYEVWQVSAGSLHLRKSASTNAKSLAKIPFGAEVNVTKVKVKSDYIWGYTKYKSKKGWVALDFCDYIWGNINGVYYQLKPKVSPKKATLYAGYTKTLSKTNGLGGKFSSSDKSIAKVNSSGKITAVKAGTAKITLTTSTGKSTCKVTVKNPSISKKTATACIGDSFKLSVKHTKLTPTWSSSDKTIAKVNSKGKVTGVKEGVVTIKALVGEVTLKCTFTVTKYPTTYENFKTKRDTYLKKGSTDLKSLVKVPKGTDLKVSKVYYTDTWSMGYTKYNGKKGWIILNKCKYLNGSIDGTYYYVRPYLKTKSTTVYLQNVYYIKIKDIASNTTYSSSNSKIARVAKNGKIRGMKAGTTTINIKSGSAKLKFEVTVKNPAISSKSVTLVKDKKKKLTVTGGSGAITWSTSDKKVAEVDSNGEITAKGMGTATIKAVRNGITMSCTVKVYDPILNITSKTIKVKEKVTLKVSQHSGAAVTWKSANSQIAKVSTSGVVTGVKAGTTTISAAVDGVTLKCTIKVKAAN